MSIKTIAGIIGGIAIVGVGTFFALNGGNNGNAPNTPEDFSGGVSTAVACEDIAATRGLVNTELAERKSSAADTLASAMETASDNYWEKRRALEDAKRACESEANLADPCKKAFEEVGRLYEEIMADFHADRGFNEAKFNEREEAKKKYNECVKNPPRENTTPGMLEQCLQTFNAGNEQALSERNAEEEVAKQKHDDFIKQAESEHQRKMTELDALEKECEDTKYERKYGSLPGTGIPVTDYQGGSSACTGIFPGNDPDLSKRISRLQSLKQQAEAGGSRAGFLDASELGSEINRLKAEMAAGDAKCNTDADCGGSVPVCCNVQEVGRAFCSDGICKNEKTMCGAEEVCAGKPAACLRLVQVIEYQGSLLPTSQLRIGNPEDGCSGQHWHGSATALDGKHFSDPASDGCGFGTLDEKPAFSVYPPSQTPAGGTPDFSAPSGGGSIQIRGGIFGN